MTDAEVYRKAAELVFKGTANNEFDLSHACCCAIADHRLENRFSYYFFPGKYADTKYAIWWPADVVEERLIALLLMAEMAEGGDL